MSATQPLDREDPVPSPADDPAADAAVRTGEAPVTPTGEAPARADAAPPVVSATDDLVGALLEAEDGPNAAEGAEGPEAAGSEVAAGAPRERGRAAADGIERATPFLLWSSLALVLTALVYGAWAGGADRLVAALFAGGLFVFASVFLAAAATRSYSPLLLTGVLMRRRRGPSRPAVLAGNDILSALGLAEGILSADPEARLVTTREGVVVYANEAYMTLAEEAGVIGATGLPPRIDRLFGQSGRESTKMFRLARAARSGAEGDEVITQAMGAQPVRGSEREGGEGRREPARRRFEVAVRPMQAGTGAGPGAGPGAGSGAGTGYVAWRLREVPIENARDDLKIAYADNPRAVVALERSGNLAWANRAAEHLFGLASGQTASLSDLLLGETSDVIAGLWSLADGSREEAEARMRDRQAASGQSGVVMTAFARGGIGEGFVCVEVAPKATGGQAAPQDLSADVTEAPFGVAVLEGEIGSDARVVSANRLMREVLNTEPGVTLGTALPGAALKGLKAATASLRDVLRENPKATPLTRPEEVTFGQGAQARFVRFFVRPVPRRRGAYGPRQHVLYAVDVTHERRMAEDQKHDQSLKQIGHLAGSIAHDFNNLLLVVMGSTELLMRRHAAGDPSYPDLVLIRENAQRARNLTQNLLAFSRKQTLQQVVLDLTEVLSDFTPFLSRYVTERVKLEVRHGRGLPKVKADKGQLELCLMNLAVNARDAMPEGGSLLLESKLVPAKAVASYGYAVLDPVPHVLIEVADDGQGVPEAIAEQIFEPFFTTKGEGQGTGLGLSTVHGIIGQMGGRIFLHNRPGEGATFRIFLPALSEEEARAAARETEAAAPKIPESADLTGKGRILIVEDEDGVRNIVVRALGMCGYEIHEAEDGDEALEIIEDEPPFDLVLTDIMMPEMDGPTLITQAGDKLSGAKVIFMSGYAETAMREKLSEIDGAGYLQKPFTLKRVAAAVKEALGG